MGQQGQEVTVSASFRHDTVQKQFFCLFKNFLISQHDFW